MQGPTGPQGPAGKSAYAAAQEAGYTGTETAFNAALSNVPGHIGNGTIHVTAEEKTAWNAKADKSVSFTVSLSAAGWADNAQTVSDARFLAEGFAYIVSSASGNFYDYGDAGIYAEDVNKDGQMVFHCEDAPDTDLTVNIVRMVMEE